MAVRVGVMAEADLAEVVGVDGGPGWNASAGFWADVLAAQDFGAVRIALARCDGAVAGYGYLDTVSQHAKFRAAGMPEIKDLRVAASWRGRGIAGALLDVLEAWAADMHSAVGLGVGLSAGYGAAQRLYIRRGYVPDGDGVTWRHEYPVANAGIRLDDDLLLWLAKDLSQRPRG